LTEKQKKLLSPFIEEIELILLIHGADKSKAKSLASDISFLMYSINLINVNLLLRRYQLRAGNK